MLLVNSSTNSGTPSVRSAMTGWGQDEDRRKSSAAGFDAHLVKPVAPGDLFKLKYRLGSFSPPAAAWVEWPNLVRCILRDLQHVQ
jgi:CheY-like chemotaxis protein